MSKIRSITGGVAVLMTALALGHGGRAAEPKTYTTKELQAMYADALRDDGYKPEAHGESYLKVPAGGRTYFVHTFEKTPKFFAINIAYTVAAGEDVEPILVAGNRVNVEHPGVKFYVSKTGCYVLETGQYLTSPESAKTVLPLALADLDKARKAFEPVFAPKPPAK